MMDDQDDFHQSLADVVQGAKLPAKRRGTNIKPAVETLCTACFETGILPDDLRELVDLITKPSHLDQASLNHIIKNLYPAAAVESDIIVNIAGCLGHGVLKPSLAIQAALLKWIIMVYPILDKQSVLSQCYSVLFSLLDTAALRPQLCHLLALITRRKHVRPYRIQRILSLSRQTGNDPALTGLLRVFKDYYPEIVVGEATWGKASAFKHPDPQWRERLQEIREAHAQSLQAYDGPKDAFRVARLYANGKRRANLVPEVHTSHAQETSVTLEEIENVKGLVDELESIEMPNQLIAVLSDPLLQKLLLLRPDGEAHQRISNWLVSCAQDLLGGEGLDELEGILEPLKTYASATKNLPPVVLSFFSEFLKTWDGRQGRHAILEILSYAPLPTVDFSELYHGVFQPLEGKVLDGTADSQVQLLQCYAALLRNWITFMLAQEPDSPRLSGAASDLVSHGNAFCLAALQTSNGAPTQCAILGFYEQAAFLASKAPFLQHARIVVPPSPLVYLLFFGSDPSTISRLSGILARYKEGFQAVMAKSRTGYTIDYINGFNGFLMDICNCLWRGRAFNAQDANAHGCLLARAVVDELAAYAKDVGSGVAFGSLFTLSASPAFGLLATDHLRAMEEAEMEQGPDDLEVRHGGPVFKASLAKLAKEGGLNLSWDDFRLGVLSHLEEHGMGGVGVLMGNTMTTLMKRA